MSGLYLTVSILVVVGLVFAMMRGLAAVERQDEERKKKKEEARAAAKANGQDVCIPPATQKQDSIPADWGGIQMPPDHFTDGGHGHGGLH